MCKPVKTLSGQQIWQMGGFYIGIHPQETQGSTFAYTTVRCAIHKNAAGKLAPRHQSRVRGKGRSTGQGIGSREEGAERREERLGRREGRGGQAVGGRREDRGGRRERREEGGRRSREENGEGKEEREGME